MIIRTLNDLETQGRIKFPADASFRSARFVTAADGLGFSYNENRVRAGMTLDVWLKHHWEANVILSGRGTVTDLTTGAQWPLEAGVLYVVGPNDRHRLAFTEDECHVSIFCPPLTGEERFDEDGSYEPSGPIPQTDRRMFVRRGEEIRRDGKAHGSVTGAVETVPLLTGADEIGFTVSDVRLAARAELPLAVSDACHIVSGTGEVSGSETGPPSAVGPSTLLIPRPGERHSLRAGTDMHLLRMGISPPHRS